MGAVSEVRVCDHRGEDMAGRHGTVAVAESLILTHEHKAEGGRGGRAPLGSLKAHPSDTARNAPRQFHLWGPSFPVFEPVGPFSFKPSTDVCMVTTQYHKSVSQIMMDNFNFLSYRTIASLSGHRYEFRPPGCSSGGRGLQ